MSAITAYRQTVRSRTRIDVLLNLYEIAIQRTELAIVAISGPDQETATRLRTEARLAVLGLWSGVAQAGSEMTDNLNRLYRFSTLALANGSAQQVQGALVVLKTLAEGFMGIRDEAAALERAGTIPPLTASCAVNAMG